ncbi:Pol polyprotein [Dictyocoela roeselum]|nr:Pol polyprotein [Dictyocoela roeselum]
MCKNQNFNENIWFLDRELILRRTFAFVSSDIFGPLKALHFKTNEENTYFYLITFTDIYSRYTEAFFLQNITAHSVTKAFKKWCHKYGYPSKLLSDQSRQYISSKFKKFLKNHNIKHVLTSAYNPTCNGISERINSTIATICKISGRSTIPSLIKNISIGLNLPCHSKLKTSPFEMIFKYSILDVSRRNLSKKIQKLKREEAMNIKIDNQKMNQGRIKHQYKIGGLIYKKTHYPDKILDKWKGPFKITKIIKNDTFIIDEVNKLNRVNIKNIKPFGGGKDVVTQVINY